MARRAKQPRQQLVDLLRGRPGWRLEPRTTPGATPLWCFVANGRVVYSVTAESGLIRLYIMDSDEEVALRDTVGLTAWLQEHRPEAMQDMQEQPTGTKRARKFFEWG
jgi:hypothetical protein